MSILGPADISILTGAADNLDTDAISVDMSDAMLTYRKLHCLDGIPIVNLAQLLMVGSLALLRRALRLQQQVCTFMHWISPDSDSAIKQLYDSIQQAAVLGRYTILLLIKQFDAAKSAFIVFVKYAKMQYTLNPRFQYLQEASII